MFWLWQKINGQESKLSIDPQYKHYPGTNNVDSQGPSAGQIAGAWLDLDSPLDPFTMADLPSSKTDSAKSMTSNDILNIEGLGGLQAYTYGPGKHIDI